jgi:NADP-dependent 3-hydroxy acid dehydrogenase YdfG
LSSFQAFAKEGAKVIATDINEAKLKELEAESPSGCLALI